VRGLPNLRPWLRCGVKEDGKLSYGEKFLLDAEIETLL